ncbi:acid-sensing ion channel 2-like isoform X2 [Pomacea canaliculata]|uniref:acid-sensing ion channel 2-like isoform X2 n=1 Tax=Pomacea canaliculata TaxID=400727 RepID=UPI000D7255AE|nr:acid-sensing ion channel 2-like isoform X2 [Pomacea canaliculata]
MYANHPSHMSGRYYYVAAWYTVRQPTMNTFDRDSLRVGPMAAKRDTQEQVPQNERKMETKEKKEITFLDYAMETSTIQGLAKMWAVPLVFLKVMWLLLLLVASGMMIYQLVQLFQQYFQRHIKTEVSLAFSPLPLPAVTICNTNMVRLSQASKLSCFLQDALGVPKNPACSHDNISLTNTDVPNFGCAGNCEGNLDSTALYQYYLEIGLANTSRQLLKEVGHQPKDMILNCSITGIDCVYQDFTHSLSYDYGNCYTLSRPNYKSTTSGPLQGLFLQLNIESDEYLSTEESGYGLRVILHEDGTRPNPTNEGFTVAAGSEVFVAIRMVNVNSQGPPYGSCDNGKEYKQKTDNTYTIGGCRDLCFRTAILQNCSCVPLQDDFALLLNDSFCSSDQEYDCMSSFYTNYFNGLNNGNDSCACSKPCSESAYQASVTSRPWPLLEEVRQYEGQACDFNPDSPKCDYKDQSFTVDTYELRRSSFMRLQVYYDRLNYEIIAEKPAYEVERFLSDIGGTLGLWIGASVLGLAELLEIVILLLVRCHRANKRHVTST